jgi:hypothetical protein
MADNVTITEGSGTQIAADEVGGVKYQRVKVAHGIDGVAVDTSEANPLPTQIIQTDTSQALQVADETVGLLKILVDLLFSNAIVDAGQRQRIVIDAITAGLTLSNITTVAGVTTVNTVSSVSNIAALFGVNNQAYNDMLNSLYDSGIRSRITL